MICWHSWKASCLQASFIQELRASSVASSSSLPVTSKATMVAHTVHRLPTGSTRAVLSFTPVMKRALQAWRRILLEPLGTREICVPLELAFCRRSHLSDGAFPKVRPWMPREDTLPRIGWVIVTALRSKSVSPAESSPKTSSQVGLLEQILSRLSKCWEPWQRSTGWLRGAEERGSHCWLILNVLKGLCERASNAPDLTDMVSAFWDICTVHDLATYVARVPTDSNVSDQVSRGSFLVEKRGGVWMDQTPPLWIMSGDARQAELDRREQTPESQS